ncbi:hypothetical protein PDESU_04512 [Pontiella desulfatans]|uniref:tRNA3(Ser)-specific nuclease WapA n=1 Tax=Pontiella desulfatans TaxID=2750659 RepID=A0A6C2U7X5_PONDE|nr:RHS repeat-associated core domain-containing protein [Pontiella desulfatans]VGO15923.1 hypothetical protein PDESU_04512 [Pontiella desulfatans]
MFCVFDGGLSIQEYEVPAPDSQYLITDNLRTEFVRGEGMGGGVGGMVYSLKHQGSSIENPAIICSHANHRGDVIARSNASGSLTSFALYEAYGTRPYEWGDDPDRQKANTKEEEKDLGLLNERMRFRDLETGVFLTRDPIGYADGPNVYCYVHSNPITQFDPLGLELAVAMSPAETVDEYIANCDVLLAAIEYLEQSGVALELLGDIAEWGETVSISFNDSDDNRYIDADNTIKWDSNSGLGVGENGDVQSAALGLAHELGHAAKDKAGIDQSAADVVLENEIIAEYETPIANELGEPTREHYSDINWESPDNTMPDSTTFINNTETESNGEAEKESPSVPDDDETGD